MRPARYGTADKFAIPAKAGIQKCCMYWVPASPAAKRIPGRVEAAGTTKWVQSTLRWASVIILTIEDDAARQKTQLSVRQVSFARSLAR